MPCVQLPVGKVSSCRSWTPGPPTQSAPSGRSRDAEGGRRPPPRTRRFCLAPSPRNHRKGARQVKADAFWRRARRVSDRRAHHSETGARPTRSRQRHRAAAAALTPCYPAGSSGRGARLARDPRRDGPDGTAHGKPDAGCCRCRCCCCCLFSLPRLSDPGLPPMPRLRGSACGGAREPRSLRQSAGPHAVRRAARLLRRARHTRALWRRARNEPPTCDGGATCRVGRGGVRCRR
jgi:hypothetical protein